MPKEGYSDVYGSQFVAPEEIDAGKKITLVIASHNVQQVEGFKNGKKLAATKKCVLTCTFNGKPCKSKIAVNKTSAKRLRAAWGDDFDNWNGKTITVESGLVQGKPAVLLTPVKGKGEPAQAAPVESFNSPIPDDQQ